MIYSNIEDNLINTYKLEHHNKNFVIKFSEFNQIANEYTIDGHSVIDRFDYASKEYIRMTPNVIEKDSNGVPTLVECPPVMRFIKVGMNAEKANIARRNWTLLNKLRHVTPENEQIISATLKDRNISRKELITEILEFFKEEQLYTRD